MPGWKSVLKHQWLYLNTLDTLAAVERLVAFYVFEHNTYPHAAFRGETPGEMYTGRGADVAEKLSLANKQARSDRIAANRAQRCLICQPEAQNQECAPMMA